MKTVDDLKSDLSEYQSIITRARWFAVEAVQLICGNLRRFGVGAETLNALKRELQGWDASKQRWKR